MKFKISKTKNKLFHLIAGIGLNILSVSGSLLLPSSTSKFSYAPFNFLGEFFTINWCVGNSVITIIYSLNELNNERQKKVSSERQKNFGLVVAVSNLIASLVFTSTLFLKPNLLPENRDAFGGTNALIWHYVAPLIALNYYFKFAKIKKEDFQKKSILGIVLPMPVFFFFANLARRFLAQPEYLGEKLKKLKFKKFLVPPFQGLEEGKFTLLTLFIVFGILSFWLTGYLLLKTKINFSKSKTKKLTTQKQKFQQS